MLSPPKAKGRSSFCYKYSQLGVKKQGGCVVSTKEARVVLCVPPLFPPGQYSMAGQLTKNLPLESFLNATEPGGASGKSNS